MNYKTLKRSVSALGTGLALWYGAGMANVETTPNRVLSDATRIGCIDSVVQDSYDTRTMLGMAGKTLTYAGLAGIVLSFIPRKKQ